MSEPRLPIWLVTGFLGSGKTTLLRRIVAGCRDRRLVFLVNEFSDVDVDAGLIEAEGGEAVAIPGGSIFCRCLAGRFVDHLGRVAALSGAEPVSGIVIEASGMADPSAMGQLLSESGLDQRLAFAQLVTIVDPSTFSKLCATLPNIVRQVECADLVLINKDDLHDEEELRATEARVGELNRRATILRCTDANVPLELVLATPRLSGALDLSGELAPCRDPRFERTVVSLARPVVLERLEAQVLAVGDELYRVKGLVPTPSGTFRVDYSGGRFRAEPADEEAREHRLVFVWSGTGTGRTEEAIAKITALQA